VKLVLVGGSKVGKWQLLELFAGNSFTEADLSTIGVRNFHSENGDCIRIRVWDIAEELRYLSVVTYYRKLKKSSSTTALQTQSG